MATSSITAPALSIEESYRLCEHIARTRALNFYFSFLPLPRPRRRAMYAVYAFMRHCDDLADDPAVSDRAGQLQRWRESLARLGSGDTSAHPIMPAVYDAIVRYEIPLRYFEEVIDGAVMDLVLCKYQTFPDLYRYCYRVASAVGLVCLKVFGCQDDGALELGEKLGVAFQLTNILRDLREDALDGRVYLPQEDLDRFGCSSDWFTDSRVRSEMRPLLEFEAQRAQKFYEDSLPLIEMTPRESRASLGTMICIYHALLRRIRQQDYEVLASRISLPTARKMSMVAVCYFNPVNKVQREIVLLK